MADYSDDDLVYINPLDRSVIGKVEWLREGVVKPLELEVEEKEPKFVDKDKRPRKKRRRFCPWGTYKSMKNFYRLEGKEVKEDGQYTVDQGIEMLAKDPFIS